MSRNLTIFFSIIALILVIVLYPMYAKKSVQKVQSDVYKKTLELSQLILKNHDCDKVIALATDFLKTHTTAVDVWSALGVCKFDAGKFDEAKVVFQKIISLDSQNVPAQNYLKQMELPVGQVMITSTNFTFDKTQFESKMGVSFDNVLTFVKAVKQASNIPEYLVANYTNSKTVASTVTSIQSLFKKVGIDTIISQTGTATVLATGNETEIKIIKVSKGMDGKTAVEMNYQKLR